MTTLLICAPRRLVLLAIAAQVALLTAFPTHAVVCEVPAALPTIADAVLDPSCTEIVLAAQSFSESVTLDRDLTLRGAGATSIVLGPLVVTGPGTAVTLADFAVDFLAVPGAIDAVAVEDGAVATMTNVVALATLETQIFTDGFESGDTAAWSSVVP